MKRILLAFGVVLAALIVWYEVSPAYTLNQMRKAADSKNGAKLSAYVDYQALKIDLKGDLRREILLEAHRRGAERDPTVKLAADVAVALVGPGVDLLVTPEAVQAMFDAKSAASTVGRGPAAGGETVGVMPVSIPRSYVMIERNSVNQFKVRTRGKPGAAIFRRHGFSWKLVGVDMPYRFGAAQK